MTLNSSGEGIVPKVAHGPPFLSFDVRVASGRGPTHPMEERRIRSWGTDEGVPGPGCKILQVKHNLVNANRHIPHQAFQVLQLHIRIVIALSLHANFTPFINQLDNTFFLTFFPLHQDFHKDHKIPEDHIHHSDIQQTPTTNLCSDPSAILSETSLPQPPDWSGFH